jgi:hypothetical protein
MKPLTIDEWITGPVHMKGAGSVDPARTKELLIEL